MRNSGKMMMISPVDNNRDYHSSNSHQHGLWSQWRLECRYMISGIKRSKGSVRLLSHLHFQCQYQGSQPSWRRTIYLHQSLHSLLHQILYSERSHCNYQGPSHSKAISNRNQYLQLARPRQTSRTWTKSTPSSTLTGWILRLRTFPEPQTHEPHQSFCKMKMDHVLSLQSSMPSLSRHPSTLPLH